MTWLDLTLTRRASFINFLTRSDSKSTLYVALDNDFVHSRHGTRCAYNLLLCNGLVRRGNKLHWEIEMKIPEVRNFLYVKKFKFSATAIDWYKIYITLFYMLHSATLFDKCLSFLVPSPVPLNKFTCAAAAVWPHYCRELVVT